MWDSELERQLSFLGVTKDNLKHVFLTHILRSFRWYWNFFKNFPNTKVLVHRRKAPFNRS